MSIFQKQSKTNCAGLETSWMCSHVAQTKYWSHGIHSTSEARTVVQLLYFELSGLWVSQAPCVFKRPLSPLNKKNEKIQSIMLCTYGLRHFKGYHKVKNVYYLKCLKTIRVWY